MLFLTKYESNLIYYLVLINPYKFMSSYFYFPNKLKDKKSHIDLDDNFQNLFPINGNYSCPLYFTLVLCLYLKQYLLQNKLERTVLANCREQFWNFVRD